MSFNGSVKSSRKLVSACGANIVASPEVSLSHMPIALHTNAALVDQRAIISPRMIIRCHFDARVKRNCSTYLPFRPWTVYPIPVNHDCLHDLLIAAWFQVVVEVLCGWAKKTCPGDVCNSVFALGF